MGLETFLVFVVVAGVPIAAAIAIVAANWHLFSPRKKSALKTLEERIAELESGAKKIKEIVGEEKEKEEPNNPFSFVVWDLGRRLLDDTLLGKAERIRADFDELDKKFDALERFLEIEFVKRDESVQTYDWADKKQVEEYRKTKPYEKVKAEKEGNRTTHCCD